MAKSSKDLEWRARAVCVELARATDSRPMHWRTVGPIGQAVGLDDASTAVAYDERRAAVAQVMRWAGLPDAGCFTELPPQAAP